MRITEQETRLTPQEHDDDYEYFSCCAILTIRHCDVDKENKHIPGEEQILVLVNTLSPL